jgi:hypothetical protein
MLGLDGGSYKLKKEPSGTCVPYERKLITPIGRSPCVSYERGRFVSTCSIFNDPQNVVNGLPFKFEVQALTIPGITGFGSFVPDPISELTK